jgi:hypothetical protein
MTTTSTVLKFHGNWSDYIGAAGNVTLNDRGSVTMRIDTSGVTIPRNSLLNARVIIENTAKFFFISVVPTLVRHTF